jgi:hypothetical protein
MAVDEQVEERESEWCSIWFPSYGIGLHIKLNNRLGSQQFELQMDEDDTEKLAHILLEAARLSRGRKDPIIANEITEAQSTGRLILRPKNPVKRSI